MLESEKNPVKKKRAVTAVRAVLSFSCFYVINIIASGIVGYQASANPLFAFNKQNISKRYIIFLQIAPLHPVNINQGSIVARATLCFTEVSQQLKRITPAYNGPTYIIAISLR